MSTKAELVFLPSSVNSDVNAEITLKDLNGNHYLGQMEGEELVAHDANMYIFPSNMPVATEPLRTVEIPIDMFKSFVRANFAYLKSIQASNDILKGLNDQLIQSICYLRFLCVKHGLVSPLFKPENFFVNYTECFPLNIEEIAAAKTPTTSISAEDIKAAESILKGVAKIDTTGLKFRQGDFNKNAKLFTDLVCLVAYVFRARAHHYTPALQEVYERVWKKCRIETGNDVVSFQHIATVVCHPIYPTVLDAFWIDSVEKGKVNGALIKRLNCAPSGAAGPYVLEQGLLDMELIAPGIRSVMKESIAKLDDVLIELKKHRFNGSVNARYYGAKRLIVDEKHLGAIAATIYAAVTRLADNAPIGKSPALKRIADNAPITGNVFANTIANIGRRPETINKLLLIESKPNE